jgi:hypothetical protein
MIDLMKYTYLLDSEKVKKELDRLWQKYQKIVGNNGASWEEMNEARAILFLTGQIYCEKIAVEAIERRLHLLKKSMTILEFVDLIDKKSKELSELRKDKTFSKLEKFYVVIKEFKNKYTGGVFYLDEEKFIKRYNQANPEKELQIGYKGKFSKEDKKFMK